jgi:hypothetical protein
MHIHWIYGQASTAPPMQIPKLVHQPRTPISHQTFLPQANAPNRSALDLSERGLTEADENEGGQWMCGTAQSAYPSAEPTRPLQGSVSAAPHSDLRRASHCAVVRRSSTTSPDRSAHAAVRSVSFPLLSFP